MKILLLIDNLGSGGAQRQMVILAEIFKNAGINVEFLVYHDADFFRKKVESLNLKINEIYIKNSLYRIIKVRNFIRSGNFDIIISFMDVPNFLNCISAVGGTSWKVITSERSCNIDIFYKLKHKIFNWFQRWSNCIICNSDNAYNLWMKHYPIYKHKLKVIYNPIKLPEITSVYKPLDNGKLNIVIAASFQEIKNPIGLIKAVSQLNEKDKSKICIFWYGENKKTEHLINHYNYAQKLVIEYNLENQIKLLDPSDDIFNIMNKADIVSLFSKYEGLPNSILEAMIIGKPIIMTEVSDFHKLVDENNGFLCQWDNPNSIKVALQKAINLDKNQLLKMGNHSKTKAFELFSFENIKMQWINTIY